MSAPVAMEEVPELSYKGLDLCGYRQLQKMAKSMGLPSNVKKVYLIEMIIAKHFSPRAEFEAVVNRVKMDRLKVSQSRWWKRRINSRTKVSEVTSTSKHSPSPSITMTPKRPSYVIQYSPDTSQSVIKYQPHKTYPVKKPKCDRILRSSSTKTPRPDYAMMDDLAIYGNGSFNTNVARPQNTALNMERDYSIMNHASSESSYNTKIVTTNLNTKLLKPNCTIMERQNSVTSFNAKIMKPGNTEVMQPTSSKARPRYAIIDRNNTITNIVKGQNCLRVKAAVPRVAVQRQSLLNASLETQSLLMQKPTNTSSPIPTKRKRTVSGIYPIETQQNTYYECVETVAFRHTDGKITKINALIQKPRNQYPIKTVQDVINRKIENQIFKTSNNESTDQIYKAIQYKPVITTENVSSITKDNIQPVRQCLDSSTNCTQNSVLATMLTEDFSTKCIDKKLPASEVTNISQTANKADSTSKIIDLSTHATKQCNDLSTSCIEITQPVRQFVDSSSTPTYTNVMIKGMPDTGKFSVYYHKKIRSEEIRHRLNEHNESLPRISEVFSQFNKAQYRNLTQPLYIQVGEESERLPHYPMLVNNPESVSMLETLYNFRQQLIVNEPLLKIATTTNTRCVFTANTVVTAVAHPPPMYNNTPSYAQVDAYNSNIEADTRLYDYMRMAERERYQRDFCCNEVLSPVSSVGTANSQELGANVTIPEMVEDALELISQDGDYLERIGMDARMQCVMCECEWVGSQLVLEYHIRQAHQQEILYKESCEWSIVVTLGSLATHEIWLSHVVQYNEHLYIVSAKYLDDCIMVALTTVTEANQPPKRGRITMYNKISGKPFTWEDEILFIPETMPYQCTENCLKINIANLDLLPNSANLKLVNNELITSDTKVVVGQPSLNNIEIVMYVNIFD